MAGSENEVPKSWDKVKQDQLFIYAEEFSVITKQVAELREQLHELNNKIEQRKKELQALNNLFQQLAERQQQVQDAAGSVSK